MGLVHSLLDALFYFILNWRLFCISFCKDDIVELLLTVEQLKLYGEPNLSMQLSELVASTCKWFCKPVQMLLTLACVPCVYGQHLTHCKLGGSTIYKLYLWGQSLSICTNHKVVYPKQVVSQYSHCWFLTGTLSLPELTQTEVLKLSPQLWEIRNSWWVFWRNAEPFLFHSCFFLWSTVSLLFPVLSAFSNSCLLLCDTSRCPRSLFCFSWQSWLSRFQVSWVYKPKVCTCIP